MDISLQKTIIFLIFIAIGLLLKLKFNQKEEITGIKKIILNLALPATIFIALLSIKLKTELFLLPVLAITLNLLLFLAFPYLLPLCRIKKGSADYRTAALLVPSLAPGLSSFPFIMEYLGDAALAKAAMADLGNKVFVLLILYVVAMNWFYKVHGQSSRMNSAKMKDLITVLISEPVNIFIVAALIMLGFGYHLGNLPFFLSETLQRLSLLMTPLVLLFIGLAVSVKKGEFQKIFSLLILRTGVVLLISSAFIYLANIQVGSERLIVLAFSMSACSFWPFAHIAAVAGREKNEKKKKRTFSSSLAVNILAFSFPLSIVFILGMFTIGEEVTQLPVLLGLALVFTLLGVLPSFLRNFNASGRKSTVGNTFEPNLDKAEAEGA